jgi:hypothetical protein
LIIKVNDSETSSLEQIRAFLANSEELRIPEQTDHPLLLKPITGS